jgi:hypothetical protein
VVLGSEGDTKSAYSILVGNPFGKELEAKEGDGRMRFKLILGKSIESIEGGWG